MEKVYKIVNLNVVPERHDGQKYTVNGIVGTVGHLVADIIGNMQTDNEIHAALAVDLAKRLYENRADEIIISFAEYNLVRKNLDGAKLVAWVKICVNTNILKEEFKNDSTA